MSDFPVLDAPRSNEFGRTIFDVFGEIEPYIEELDDWCAMPVRLTHSQVSDWSVEVGPYTLDAADVRQLRKALAAYDEATHGRRCTCNPDPRRGQ